jgi:hypothetical protein
MSATTAAAAMTPAAMHSTVWVALREVEAAGVPSEVSDACRWVRRSSVSEDVLASRTGRVLGLG